MNTSYLQNYLKNSNKLVISNKVKLSCIFRVQEAQKAKLLLNDAESLTDEEKDKLISVINDGNKAFEMLIKCYTPYILKKASLANCPKSEELLNAIFNALYEAIIAFNPKKGAGLETYAEQYVKNAISTMNNFNYSPISIPKYINRDFMKINLKRIEYFNIHKTTMPTDELNAFLDKEGITRKRCTQMNNIHHIDRLDKKINPDDEDSPYYSEAIESTYNSPEEELIKSETDSDDIKLINAFLDAKLTAREIYVIAAFNGIGNLNKKTMKELAKELNTTCSNIRNIKVKATRKLEKLRKKSA